MSWKGAISKDTNGGFYALVVRDENNGRGGIESIVNRGYKGRFFATKKAAEKSVNAYIAKNYPVKKNPLIDKLKWRCIKSGAFYEARSTYDKAINYRIESMHPSKGKIKQFYLYKNDGGLRTSYPSFDSLKDAKTKAQLIDINFHKGVSANPISKKNLSALKKIYKDLVKITPQETDKLIENFRKLDDESIELIKKSKIRFLSPLALSEIERRKHAKNNPIKNTNPKALKTALKVDQAKQLRAGFRATAGGAAGQTGKIKTVARRKADNVQMVVGIIDCIEYTVLDDQGRRIKGQSFRHEFSGKSCPLLTCSHDGKQLYFMGGSYRFKTDGINDI